MVVINLMNYILVWFLFHITVEHVEYQIFGLTTGRNYKPTVLVLNSEFIVHPLKTLI